VAHVIAVLVGLMFLKLQDGEMHMHVTVELSSGWCIFYTLQQRWKVGGTHLSVLPSCVAEGVLC